MARFMYVSRQRHVLKGDEGAWNERLVSQFPYSEGGGLLNVK